METIKFLTPGKISKHKDSEKIDFSSTKVNTFSSSIINDKHPLLLERKLKEKNFHKSLQLSRKDDHEVMSTTSIKSDLESMLLFEKKKQKDRNLQFSTTSANCATKPTLISFNSFNNSIYDDRIAQLIQNFQNLSSTSVLQDFESPQYKAACFIIFDDPLAMTVADGRYLTERYAIFVFFYSTNWFGNERVYSIPTCDYFGLSCNNEKYIQSLNYYDNSKQERTRLLSGRIPTEIGYLEHLSEFICGSYFYRKHVT